jgi:hypothetical protein
MWERHVTAWGYQRVRQPLVIPRRSRPEERGPALLRGLQETERHRERLFTLLQFDDILDTFDGARQFSTLDLNSRYWQVDLHPDKEKATFSTGEEQRQFTIIHFSLCNAQATFGRLKDIVLRSLIYDSRLVNLGGLIVISHTFAEHLLNLRKVFQRFQQARPKLNPEKCQLIQKEVRYLRQIVT